MKSAVNRGTADEVHVDVGSFGNLSPREAQVLQLAAHGFLDKEISAELGVSLNTLRTYWTRIRGKVGDAPRIALATAFVENRTAPVVPSVLTENSADWEVDFTRNTIIYHTADPNSPEIPVGVERPLQDAIEKFHPDDAPTIQTAMRGVFEGSLSSFIFTARRITSRGVVLATAFVQVVRDEAGNPNRLFGKRTIPIDARAAANDVVVGLWSRDLRTGEIWLDEGFRRIFGLTGDEPNLREAIIERNHPDDRALALKYVDEMIAQGQTHSRQTFRILDEDETYRWASADIHLESDADGPVRTRGTILVYPR